MTTSRRTTGQEAFSAPCPGWWCAVDQLAAGVRFESSWMRLDASFTVSAAGFRLNFFRLIASIFAGFSRLPGAKYHDRRQATRTTRRTVAQLERLNYRVTLERAA